MKRLVAAALYGTCTYLNINPSGEFITGDPQDDAGSTGRNIENGTYVSWGAQFISCKFGDSVTGVHWPAYGTAKVVLCRESVDHAAGGHPPARGTAKVEHRRELVDHVAEGIRQPRRDSVDRCSMGIS